MKAAGILLKAREEGEGTENGSVAALALARLDYAQDHPEVSLLVLDAADAWPRPDSRHPEWLYWRADREAADEGCRRARRLPASVAWPTGAGAAGLLGRPTATPRYKSDEDRASTSPARRRGLTEAQAWWGVGTAAGDAADASHPVPTAGGPLSRQF